MKYRRNSILLGFLFGNFGFLFFSFVAQSESDGDFSGSSALHSKEGSRFANFGESVEVEGASDKEQYSNDLTTDAGNTEDFFDNSTILALLPENS